MKRLFGFRQKSMQWTDKRAKLLQELLGGMKLIKFFAWEVGIDVILAVRLAQLYSSRLLTSSGYLSIGKRRWRMGNFVF